MGSIPSPDPSEKFAPFAVNYSFGCYEGTCPGHLPQKGEIMPTATSQAGNAQQGANNAPVHAIRKHSLKASIWRNDTRNGPMYNVTLVRTYRDGEEFKDTNSLGFDDLAN